MINLDEIDRDPWSTYPVSKEELRRVHAVLEKLTSRVSALEGALLFYAEEEHWEKHPFEPSRIDMDNGRKARLALNMERQDD